MLARVANSLYWTGRYIERSEHLARYLKVQYFSLYDAPITQQKEIILQSILYMATSQTAKDREEQSLTEQDVLIKVAFDLENTTSILASVQSARENARNVRSAISTELWESINRFYHYIKNYSVEFYKTRGLYDFTTNVIQYCYVTRSFANSTLLHDEAWAFFKLGTYIERAAQIIRILSNKIIDIQSLADSEKSNPLIAFQWTITLKVLEAYDTYRKVYKGGVKQQNVISFLLTHPQLSRSVAFTLENIDMLLVSLTKSVKKNPEMEFQSGKLASSFKYLEYNDIEEDLQGFLINSLKKIYGLNDLIEKEYFE